MVRQLIAVLVVALCVGAGVTTAQTQTQGAANDTFIWHGELVSIDAGSGTLTVKAQMLTDAVAEVARFNVGDRVLVTWSGVDKYAGSVRRITKHDASQKPEEFSYPVELASKDTQNNYLTLRFRGPQSAVQSVKAVKPGEWITVTMRQRSAGDAQAIVSITPYVKPLSTT